MANSPRQSYQCAQCMLTGIRSNNDNDDYTGCDWTNTCDIFPWGKQLEFPMGEISLGQYSCKIFVSGSCPVLNVWLSLSLFLGLYCNGYIHGFLVVLYHSKPDKGWPLDVCQCNSLVSSQVCMYLGLIQDEVHTRTQYYQYNALVIIMIMKKVVIKNENNGVKWFCLIEQVLLRWKVFKMFWFHLNLLLRHV